jgi:hypothetical protein
MTSRQVRRAAERKARKQERKAANGFVPSTEDAASSPRPEPPARSPERSDGSVTSECTRAEINRANSQNSTGPRTPEGKLKSSQNSFKHGLYSKQLVLPSEDPAELDQVRASLRAEHQPANTTEEMLVNEIAENFWRLRRMRQLETRTMQPENVSDMDGLYPMIQLIQRTMASAERGFYKALACLRQLQKDRGFVPQEPAEAASASLEIGFVPQKDSQIDPDLPCLPSTERTDGHSAAPQIGFVSQKGEKLLAEAA